MSPTLVTSAAQLIASKRREVPFVCKNCGVQGTGLSTKKFCGPVCLNQYHYRTYRKPSRRAKNAQEALSV